MLVKKEFKELKDALTFSKRLLVFFDDDGDGLSSFLLYAKFARSKAEVKGVAVKVKPAFENVLFENIVEEFNPDTIFILDIHYIPQDFVDKIKRPIYILDHHPIINVRGVKYYNPLMHKAKGIDADSRPTTYWAYKTIMDKDNLWIATLGCVSDWFMPDFAKEFSKKYPDLLPKEYLKKGPQYALYETKLGLLCKIFNFSLKGSATHLNKTINFLLDIADPLDILDQRTEAGKFIFKQYTYFNKIYESLKSGITISDDGIILYVYDDNNSLTKDLSNECQYKYPDKVIIIARDRDGEVKCSLRSERFSVRTLLEKALIGVEGYGGGHEHACGAVIKKKDFEKFVSQITEAMKKQETV
jgi:single-stranded DNA-specific DHH superfamily exonuclease